MGFKIRQQIGQSNGFQCFLPLTKDRETLAKATQPSDRTWIQFKGTLIVLQRLIGLVQLQKQIAAIYKGFRTIRSKLNRTIERCQ